MFIMTWFFIALSAPILYAICNHIDKYLLEKYFKGGEAGALVLFSALFSIFALPIIYWMDPAVFSLDLKTIVVLLLNGMITVVCIVLYLKALEDDEASTVVPFTQMIPIFGFIMGYFILGEVLSGRQVFACLLVVIGIVVLSLNLVGEKIKIKRKIIVLMLTWSLLFAISDIVFKFVTVDEGNFWTSLFWEFLGRVILGIILFACIKSYRRDFLWVIRSNSFAVISVNSLNETIFIVADSIASFALLLAPVTLVMTVNSVQPVFVLIFGIILTLFFPKIFKELLSRKHLMQKFAAIFLIVTGTCMLALTGAL